MAFLVEKKSAKVITEFDGKIYRNVGGPLKFTFLIYKYS